VAGLTPDPMGELMRSPDFLAAVHGGRLLRGSSGWKEEEGGLLIKEREGR